MKAASDGNNCTLLPAGITRGTRNKPEHLPSPRRRSNHFSSSLQDDKMPSVRLWLLVLLLPASERLFPDT
ncbi:hypothetical protein NQZ68_025445 [Dissostichus eleginoides]|nr:hypothetical protein NQZ68_025445 [Dissostichus eleginoides]